jgi:hypothetical protein
LNTCWSERIQHETGNKELADSAMALASASHAYEPASEEPLSEMHADWQRRFGKSMEQS